MDNKMQLSAVNRTIVILETLSKIKKINLEQLAKKTNLPKPTLLRFLNSLISLGYVYKDNNDLYSLTLKMFSIGSNSLSHMNLIDVAVPFVDELCSYFKETVHMGILDEDHAVYILKRESSYTIRMYSRVGKRIPLYCTAIGKNLLSDLDKDEINDYINNTQFIPFTKNTLTKEELSSQLEVIKKQGWGEDDQEHEEGITCIGASIRDFSGKVVAALSVSWPIFRFKEKNKEEVVEKIVSTCDKISAQLGFEK
ncbi:MAG: IclR family transcriptional regulator domain-containing protein [Pleomorphochaeta sp.]|nr:helix-turn-helix domain-containing protein [Sphaerochaetaceae bacterium]